jgi:hypothetical protein
MPDFIGERGETRTLDPMIKSHDLAAYRTLVEQPATILLPNSEARPSTGQHDRGSGTIKTQ